MAQSIRIAQLLGADVVLGVVSNYPARRLIESLIILLQFTPRMNNGNNRRSRQLDAARHKQPVAPD